MGQTETNKEVTDKCEQSNTEYVKQWRSAHGRRLRTCSATVFETEHWYLLMSYATIVAAIEKESGICYDYLRYVYGYTRTSAQHITKFVLDYGNGKIVRWRPL